jgi:hypothetical protein
MSAPVLVLCNDFSLVTAKTSRHIGQALTRLGRTAVGRDTRLLRWAIAATEKDFPDRLGMFEELIVGKWGKFLDDYGVDTVISLDLHWLFTSRLFVDSDRIRGIHSFWFDDLRSHLKTSPMFPLTPAELINRPKVSHHCYGRGQMEELRMLGVKRVLPSMLAAPAEYLDSNAPCTVRDRIAFIGNPGMPTSPSARALQALARGENIAAMQRFARKEILSELNGAEPTASWLRQCPQVADLLAAATELRLTQPHTAAIALLAEAGKSYPQAFEFLNRGGLILDATLLVKLVNRYDRPGLVLRLYRRGWLDVYGTPPQWAPYGITAKPTVIFPQLAAAYQKHAVHLNAANCARDATANEKLFEIAACGRLSLNIDSPDVRACYSEGEIVLAESEEALDAAAERVIKDPDAALATGEVARRRTAREHLWENRLKVALA